MPKAKNLLFLLKRSHGGSRKSVEGITDAESLVTMPDNPNHIRWITGHMVTALRVQAGALGVKVDIPHGWVELFDRGVLPAVDNSEYPSMDALRAKLAELHAAIERGAEGKTDEELAGEVEVIPGWKAPAIDYANFFCIHEFYHAGQVAMIRHSLGKTRLFG